MKRLALFLSLIPCMTLAVDPKLVPDPLYSPKVGDVCILGYFSPKVKLAFPSCGARTEALYKRYYSLVDTPEKSKIETMFSSGDLVHIETGTRAEIVDLAGYPDTRPRIDSAKVQVLDGTHKGKTLWVAQDEILRKSDPVPSDAEQASRRAGSLLKSAENLEKAKRKAGAANLYADIVKNFDGTPEAKKAEARLVALGEKVPPQSERHAPKPIEPQTPRPFSVPRPVAPPEPKIPDGAQIVLTDLVIAPSGIEGLVHVDGRVKNVSGTDFETVFVDVALEDARNKFLGTITAVLRPGTLEAGATGTFQASVVNQPRLDHVSLGFASRGKAIKCYDATK